MLVRNFGDFPNIYNKIPLRKTYGQIYQIFFNTFSI